MTPIHVHAVLGKALQGGRISRGFEARLRALAGLGSIGPAFHLALCGGRGEAEAALVFLRAHPELPLPPPERLFLDRSSTTTRENISALRGWLENFPSPPDLTLISSDDHVERLRFIDRELPEVSLLRALGSAVASLSWLPVADAQLLRDHPRVELRWLGRAHGVAEALVPLQVNLEAIDAGLLPVVVESVRSRAEEAMATLVELVAAPPTVLARAHPQVCEVVEHCSTAPISSRSEVARVIASLRRDCDPEQPAFAYHWR